MSNWDATVDGIRGSHGIDQSLKVGKHLAVARLESWTVAVCIDIEGSDCAKDGVSVESSASIVLVDVGDDVLSVPEALQEAQDLWRLVTSSASNSQVTSELGALDQRAMLVLDSKEAGPEHFFPEVETSLIPVLPNVREIVGDNWPDDLLSAIEPTVVDQPVAIGHQSYGSQSRSITLRSAPCTVESSSSGQEFRFCKTKTIWEEGTRGVGNSLEDCLCFDIFLDLWQKRLVAENELVDNHLHGQSRVSSPGEEIWLC